MTQDTLLSIREFARQKMVSESTMRNHIDMGRVPVVKTKQGNKIKLPEAEDAWSRISRTSAHRGNFGKVDSENEEENLDVTARLSKAKMLKEEYNAKLAQVKYEQQKGLLIKRALVERALFELARGVRDELLAIPGKVAPEAVSMTEPQEVDNLVTGFLMEALDTISDLGLDGFLKNKLKLEAEEDEDSE